MLEPKQKSYETPGGGGGGGGDGGGGAGGSVIVTVSGTVMDAATSAGVLKTALANPEAAAVDATASIMADAKSSPDVPAAMSARVLATLSHSVPHEMT